MKKIFARLCLVLVALAMFMLLWPAITRKPDTQSSVPKAHSVEHAAMSAVLGDKYIEPVATPDLRREHFVLVECEPTISFGLPYAPLGVRSTDMTMVNISPLGQACYDYDHVSILP